MAVWIVRLELLARAKRNIVFGLEGEAGEGGKEHDDAGMHDVPAIPSSIARHEPDEAAGNALAVDSTPRRDALVELLQDGSGHEARERVRHERIPVRHA